MKDRNKWNKIDLH